MDAVHEDDMILVHHLRSHEPARARDAWAAWYERDAEAVRRMLDRVAAPGTDIEALAHDAFIVAVRGIRSQTFRYRQGRLRRYVCKVALNLLRQEWRAWRGREILFRALFPTTAEERVPALAGGELESSVDAADFEQWLAHQVRAGLAELDSEERQLLLAYHLDGRTQRELAAERNVPVSTVGVQLWRLRARLRRQRELHGAWEALVASCGDPGSCQGTTRAERLPQPSALRVPGSATR